VSPPPPVAPDPEPAAAPASGASPPPLVIKKSRPSRLAAFRARVKARLLRSSHVFLLGLLVACGIEVVVDWNSTLFEINVLRDGMRQRGLNYSRILAHSAVDPMLSFDPEALDRLCEGLFHDEDVVFVRFTDQQGTVMLDRLREKYASRFARRRKSSFPDYYASQMRRDIGGILADPDMLAQRMANSRHRDFVQAWNDLVDRLARRFSGPKPQPERRGAVVLYQDRLKRKPDGHDNEVTYALSTVTDERGEDLGVVLVAFSMDSVNDQIIKKYLKGLGMVVFFVGLILIQNIMSRREKLRLFELEERQRAAKQALREALPAGTGDTIDFGTLTVAGGLLQSEGIVDGVAWDLLAPGESGAPGELSILVVDPDGEGVSAVATSLHVLRTFRQLRAAGSPRDAMAELTTLGQAALTIPLTRPLHLWLLRLDLGSGAIQGVCSPLGGPWVLRPRTAESDPARAELTETPLCSEAETPPGLVGPLFHFSGELPPGGLLCGLFTGVGRPDKRAADGHALAEHLSRARRGRTELGAMAAAACSWARSRLAPEKGDVLVLLAARPAPGAGAAT
jgi:hypothetical protein